MIYLVANTKGGVGKSTIAVNLAAWLAAKPRRVLMIDADKQATAASWASWRRELDVEHSPKTVMLRNDMVFKEGRALAPEWDDVVIDAGGRDDSGMRYGMLLADRLIVPIAHSNFDTAAWDDMQQIIEGARVNNASLEIMIVLNRIHSSRRAPSDVVDFLTERGYSVCATQVPELVAFVRANDEGLAVFEFEKNGRAAETICKLFEEVTHG